jgi:hypothetical protein
MQRDVCEALKLGTPVADANAAASITMIWSAGSVGAEMIGSEACASTPIEAVCTQLAINTGLSSGAIRHCAGKAQEPKA